MRVFSQVLAATSSEFKINKMDGRKKMLSSALKNRRCRVVLTIAEKVKIAEDLDKGLSVSDVTRKYGIPNSTAFDLKSRKDKLKEEIGQRQIPLGKLLAVFRTST